MDAHTCTSSTIEKEHHHPRVPNSSDLDVHDNISSEFTVPLSNANGGIGTAGPSIEINHTSIAKNNVAFLTALDPQRNYHSRVSKVYPHAHNHWNYVYGYVIGPFAMQ